MRAEFLDKGYVVLRGIVSVEDARGILAHVQTTLGDGHWSTITMCPADAKSRKKYCSGSAGFRETDGTIYDDFREYWEKPHGLEGPWQGRVMVCI